ncbi:recombinase family protein [Microtetraspora malaysiensis]|uniref:recombinase family protein n=1 Tax=Microtetraspora malaysiensis TaxID=161358 RepID=UPI003D8F786E
MPPQPNGTGREQGLRRAVAYIRVSKAREKMISPENQLHEITSYAKRNRIEIVEVVSDLDLSGREFGKRSIPTIMDGIKSSRWSTVLVWKWSRWGRNFLESRLYLAAAEEIGGTVCAVTEDFDTSTSAGKFSRDQMLLIAELQSNQLADTWKETHENRRRRGLPHTSAPRLGYVYDRAAGLYRPDPETAPLLADAYERFARGESMRSITFDLNARGHRTTKGGLFTPTSLGRALDTGFAAGLIRERSMPGTVAPGDARLSTFDIWRTGSHEPIISMDLWEEYKERRLTNASKAPRLRNAVYTLSGLVAHASCGSTMNSSQNGQHNYHVWRCRKQRDTNTCNGGVASNRRVEAFVRAWVLENAKGGDAVQADAQRLAAVSAATSNQNAAKREIARLEAKRDRTVDLYTDGEITREEYSRRRDAIDADIERASELLAMAKADAREAGIDRLAVFTTLADLWDDAEPSERNEMLSKVIARVEIREGGWKDPNAKVRIVPRWES